MPKGKSKASNQAMASAHDVAAYIVEKHGPVPGMKLQKLVYYCQAWSTVWDERPLFAEKIKAWANGPVVPELYNCHKKLFVVEMWDYGDPSKLDALAKETIDAVLDYYGEFNPQQLSDLTHSETPWMKARKGLADGDRGDKEITLASMSEYYSSLGSHVQEAS